MAISEVAGTETATIKLGDVEYTMSALTLNEYAAIENDLKEDMRKELVKDTEGMGFTPVERVEYVREELAKVDVVEALREESKTCIALMAYHSIKRKHPDVEREDIVRHMSVEKLTEMASNMTIIMGTSSKKAKGQTKPKKK
ncbi:hypothetical protein KAR91_52925 [Candidatus Pacearchaeota archaeon]|nr:hypothetical protein [Candidatus Pacearchaeota archaeon]